MTWTTSIDHYVLSKGFIFMVVSVISGGDPLYLNGTWTLESGPHVAKSQAEASADELRTLEEVT